LRTWQKRRQHRDKKKNLLDREKPDPRNLEKFDGCSSEMAKIEQPKSKQSGQKKKWSTQ